MEEDNICQQTCTHRMSLIIIWQREFNKCVETEFSLLNALCIVFVFECIIDILILIHDFLTTDGKCLMLANRLALIGRLSRSVTPFRIIFSESVFLSFRDKKYSMLAFCDKEIPDFNVSRQNWIVVQKKQCWGIYLSISLWWQI